MRPDHDVDLINLSTRGPRPAPLVGEVLTADGRPVRVDSGRGFSIVDHRRVRPVDRWTMRTESIPVDEAAANDHELSARSRARFFPRPAPGTPRPVSFPSPRCPE